MSLNTWKLKMDLAASSLLIQTSIVCFLLLLPHWSDITFSERGGVAKATSINYGISQQPITDINQLMPKLCQNQSVICEGSFCIPGVRKCVCDLRMPVQFGRYCLRQIDIETKCFVTSQCNHTIKDAVCIDINSNAILDPESSRFKLDQWQQLSELRQQSQSTLNKETTTTPYPERAVSGSRFVVENSNLNNAAYNYEARNVIMSDSRNSPYEINYDTNELLSQNHTRRKTNQSERMSANAFLQSLSTVNLNQNTELHSPGNPLVNVNPLKYAKGAAVTTTATTITTNSFVITKETTMKNIEASPQNDASSTTTTSTSSTVQQSSDLVVTTTATIYSTSEPSSGKKKAVIKNLSWPPGICACPHGFMFDSMLRKCLALSLADSHCQIDSDCKQIMMSHCSSDTKKCKCDEPLVWDSADLACVRPKVVEKTEPPTVSSNSTSFIDNLMPPLILAKLLPDYTMMLLIFVFIVILATLIVLRLTVKCFSSSSSALISPKTKKKKQASSNNLQPRSPYATLRRPDHKPSSQLSNFTQATRGRILNYDFEQENEGLSKPESSNNHAQPPLPPPEGTINRRNKSQGGKDTVKKTNTRGQKSSDSGGQLKRSSQNVGHVDDLDQSMELNDNISISQVESETKSDNSVMAIPGPPPNQQPPYMLASAMKGQGSAIAAAAAAVANKRMQMAHKKNLEQQNQGKISDGSPVFL